MKKSLILVSLLTCGAVCATHALVHGSGNPIVYAAADTENVSDLKAVPSTYIVVLYWTPVQGADHYIIKRNGLEVDIKPTGTATTQTVSNLKAGTTYEFTVITVYPDGRQSDGATVTTRTLEEAITEFDKGENIALHKDTYASSGPGSAQLAVDGDRNSTRWESEHGVDPQWWYVDLGSVQPVRNITIKWETAYAKNYKIQVSDDADTWTDVYEMQGGNGGANNDMVEEIWLNEKGRYVRFYGTARATGYGYSFYEFEVYSKGPEAKLTTVKLAPASVELERGATQQFTAEGIDQYGKEFPLTDAVWRVTGGGTVTDRGLFTATEIGGPYYVELTDRSGATGRAQITVKPKVEFALRTPAHMTHIYDTHRPTFSWNKFNGAKSYQLWVNITRDDYDWAAPGNLLDRYTMVGETSDTQFTIPTELLDRWTYKWYVVAIDDNGNNHYSATNQFSLYMPTVTSVNDGIDIIDGCRDLNKNGKVDDYENWRLPLERRVEDLMSQMTPLEKAYQMFYNAQVVPEAGWVFGPVAEADAIRYQSASARTRMGIPFVSAGDCIHGYKTTYPVQSTMAASRDLDLIYRCARIQQQEQSAVGFRATLSPNAEVATKVLYDRVQEGNGEDAEFAAAEVRAMVAGLQGGPELNPRSVMVHTKHWPGEGAGGEGGIVYDGVTINYHMKPWYANKEANAAAVMPGYAGSDFLDPGGYGAGDSEPILRYLRDVVQYDGLICTDWLPVGAWIRAAKAGADIMGGANPLENEADSDDPFTMDKFVERVGMESIDASVRRILSTKFRMGLFEDPYGDPDHADKYFHTAEMHQTVVEAARKSMVLLKNNNVLPVNSKLNAGDELLVTGPRANDQGKGHSIWTSYFHNQYGAKTFLEGIQERATQDGIKVVTEATDQTKLAVVCVGESGFTHRVLWENTDEHGVKPYLHDGVGSEQTPEPDATLVRQILQRGIPVVLVYISPRPYVLGWTNDECDAIIMAGRPGDGGGEGLAQLLFGDYLPTGKLPWQLPKTVEQIGGSEHNTYVENWDLPYDLGATDAERQQIRDVISSGAQLQPIYGDPLYQFGAGMQDFGLSDDSAPTEFNLTSPANGAQVATIPTLTWTASADPETNIRYYKVYVDGALAATTRTTELKLNGVESNGEHTWYVEAENWAGKVTRSSQTFRFTISDNNSPADFRLLAPAHNSTFTHTNDLVLAWESSSDAETGMKEYEIYLNDEKITTVSHSAATANANLTAGATATASSYNGDLVPSNVLNDNPSLRWQALNDDNAATQDWIEIELAQYSILNSIDIVWEAAGAKMFEVQVSVDGDDWQTVYTGGHPFQIATDNITGLNHPCRYVKINCLERNSQYGSSIFNISLTGSQAHTVSIPNPGNGTHQWSVKAVDYAGNKTDAVQPFSFIVNNPTTGTITNVDNTHAVEFHMVDRLIFVNGVADNAPYRIYNTQGQCVRTGRGNVVTVPTTAGMYVLLIENATYKFVVR